MQTMCAHCGKDFFTAKIAKDREDDYYLLEKLLEENLNFSQRKIFAILRDLRGKKILTAA